MKKVKKVTKVKMMKVKMKFKSFLVPLSPIFEKAVKSALGFRQHRQFIHKFRVVIRLVNASQLHQ